MNTITKLKIWILIIVLTPMIIMPSLFYFASVETINKSVETFGEEMQGLNKATFHINQKIKDELLHLLNLANSEIFLKGTDEVKKQLIREECPAIIGVKEVYFFDKEGREKFSVLIGKNEKSSYFRKKWVQKALEGEISRSRVFFQENGKPWVNFTVPVYSSDKMRVIGALSANFSLKEIFHQLDKTIRKKNGLAYIVDDRGIVIYVTGDLQGKFPHLTLGTLIKGRKRGGYELERTEENLYLISSLPIGDTGWQLIWKVPLTDIAANSRQLIYNFLGASILSFLFVLLLFSFMARQLTEPLNKLMEAAQHISQGAGKKSLKVAKKDKEPIISMSFEEMQRKLRNYIEENRALYSRTRERLEKRVKELRTIHTITETFASVRDFNLLLDSITSEIKSVFQAVFCNIYLYNGGGKLILFSSQIPPSKKKEDYAFSEFPIDKDPFIEIKNELKSLIIHDVEHEEVFKEHFPHKDVGAYCVFPLYTIKEFYGVLEIGLTKNTRLSEGSIRLLGTLSKEASISIENAKLYREMEKEKEKMETILATIDDGVISTNADGIITSFNKAAERITGYSKEDVIGKPCYKIFRGIQEDEEGNRLLCVDMGCMLKRAFNQGKFPFHSEHIIITPQGKQKTLEFITTIEKEDIGGEVTFVSVFRDISEIKELERMKADFIDTISHELRTPLTSIKGYVSALLHPRAKFSYDEIKEFLKVINEEADRLNRLIGDLLEASKIHHDALMIKPQPFKIGEHIAEIVKKLKATTKIHKFNIEIEDAPVVIYGDPSQIKFVLSHLLENAVKFSPEGGNIWIRVHKSDKDKEVRVEIEDEGIGIPEDHKDKIFNIFHRVDTSNTRRIYGPGLGLFLAKKIIQAHGKKIWVETKKDKGAIFIFTLPLYIPTP